MANPQLTPLGQAPTAVKSAPFTILTARRKKSGGFSRAALGTPATIMGQMLSVEEYEGIAVHGMLLVVTAFADVVPPRPVKMPYCPNPSAALVAVPSPTPWM